MHTHTSKRNAARRTPGAPEVSARDASRRELTRALGNAALARMLEPETQLTPAAADLVARAQGNAALARMFEPETEPTSMVADLQGACLAAEQKCGVSVSGNCGGRRVGCQVRIGRRAETGGKQEYVVLLGDTLAGYGVQSMALAMRRDARGDRNGDEQITRRPARPGNRALCGQIPGDPADRAGYGSALSVSPSCGCMRKIVMAMSGSCRLSLRNASTVPPVSASTTAIRSSRMIC